MAKVRDTKSLMLDSTGRRIVEAMRSMSMGLTDWNRRVLEVPLKDVNFYDYDGLVLYSYTAEEFAELEEMPVMPVREGLVAQGWNWSLQEAQDYVADYGSCEIGMTYATDDGKTRLYIDIAETERLGIKIGFKQTLANGVTVDWGDGSEPETSETANAAVNMEHTYAEAGQYVVTMEAAENCTYMLGTDTTNNATSESITNQTKGFITSKYMGGRSPVRKLEVGNSVTAIGNSALLWCNLMESITIPQGVTAIYQLAFCGCTKVAAIVLPEGLAVAGPFAFRGCQAAKVIALSEDTVTLGMHAFSACVAMKRISIPEGVTALGGYTFRACYGLERCALPSTVASFGVNCFINCYTLRTLTIPASLTAIPDYCFARCHNLTGIELPEGLLTIGKSAFLSCFSIGTLTLPSTVTEIKEMAFLFCDGEKEMHVLATVPPVLTSGTAGLQWGSSAGDFKVYVPWSEDHSVLAAYQNATGWATLGDVVQEEEEPAQEPENDPDPDNQDPSDPDTSDPESDQGQEEVSP